MIDTHIHLYSEKYTQDIKEVIQNAKYKGVTKCINVGCAETDFDSVIKMKEEYPDFLEYSFGLHPVDIKKLDFEKSMLNLETYIVKNNPIAVGEIGLDYYYYPEEKIEQKKYFIAQLELARKYKLPVIIHTRDAYDDCLNILKEFKDVPRLIHSFASTVEMAEKFIEIGCKLSLSGQVTFKNALNQKNVAQNISLGNLMIETDGPYLTPTPFRGKRNLPEYISYVAQEIAEQKEISYNKVIEKTTKNAEEFFKLEKNENN